MRQIVIIAHDLRSVHNVGSLLRTAEGLGVSQIYLSGYTPYPKQPDDKRLPHLADKLTRQIHKTALGSELLVNVTYEDSVETILARLKQRGYELAALEQTAASIDLSSFKPPDKLAILIGNEVEGISQSLLAKCDYALEIPMFGKKESFNVVQATAMALYHCRFAT